MKVYERFMKEKGEPKTLADVGTYLHMIKEAEPRFTGRAIKNVTDAIKMRAMDIELPDDWFEKPEAFMHKGYDEKKAMIEELRGPFSMDMVMQEINRYADSEFRYSDKSDDAAVSKMLRDARLRERAVREMEELKKKGCGMLTLPSTRLRGEGACRRMRGGAMRGENNRKTTRARELRKVENEAEETPWSRPCGRRLNGFKFVRRCRSGLTLQILPAERSIWLLK